VFPVPDGDTGTNIAATLIAAAERARREQSRAVGTVSRALADGALFGACGNSGVILAQFLEGFASALEDVPRADGIRLAAAARRATDAAYGALAEPREGTILSVMRAWEERFAACVDDDLLDAFRDSLDAAREALARTPQQLRALARAGVVDAGAQGFVYFLEGILHFAEGRTRGSVAETGRAEPMVHASVALEPEGIGFRWCTEVLLEGRGLDLAAVRESIARLGDSLVVAGSPQRLRVHVHTDDPEAVFAAAALHGTVARTKADDMRAQHVARFEARERVAVVTDTAADIPERDLQRLRIHLVPLRVLLGDSVYLDKQTLAPEEVYERLLRDERAVRTSQPPPGDYAALFRYLFEHYRSIVVLSVSGALSGTIQAARAAARSVDGERITVVDSRGASIAQGLVVREAAERALAGGEVEDIVAAAEAARDRAWLVLAPSSAEYLMRGGRLRGWKAAVIRRLGLVPILSLDARHGTPRLAGLARRGRAHARALDRARHAIRREPVPPSRVWVAHAGAPEAADAFRDALQRAAPGAEIAVLEVGPSLGVHAGPGAVGVGFLRSAPGAAPDRAV
jgi:DegV family protein with EDD domain